MIRLPFALALLIAFGSQWAIAGPSGEPRDEPYEVYNFRIVSAGTTTQIVIETTGAVLHQEEFQDLPPRLTLELQGARAGLPLREYQDIYRGGVRYVVVSSPTPDRVRFDIALSGVSSYTVYEEGNDLYVTFDNPGGSFPAYAGPGGDPVDSPSWSPELAKPVSRQGAAPREPGGRPEDEGLPGIDADPVTLSFQNADIMTVIRAFGELSGESIVAGAGIQETIITADIRNEPWDEALITLMHANGLEVRVENGIIRVDSVQNLRDAELLLDLETEVLRLNFITAEDVLEVVQPLTSERGSVQSDPKTNSLVVTDVPDRVEQIRNIVEELDVQTPQVTIKAKIVFVNKLDLRELGVKWRVENLNNQTVDTHVLAETDGTLADPFLDLSIGTLASGLNVGGLLQALEQRELADIQAEPQTTVLNNLPAQIFVGDRTPIRVLDIGADAAQARATVELIETGIILDVVPHITANGKVLMRIRAERSGVRVSDPEVGVTFNTQRATSQILVDDGETAVIGGLTVQDLSTVRTGIPVLKDIPVLGGLFRTEIKRDEKRDLLIFVTPYIKPLEEGTSEVVTLSCLEAQDWHRANEPIVHNGEQWGRIDIPTEMDSRDVIAVGNYRGVAIYTTVEHAANEIVMPLCTPNLYMRYRRVALAQGSDG